MISNEINFLTVTGSMLSFHTVIAYQNSRDKIRPRRDGRDLRSVGDEISHSTIRIIRWKASQCPFQLRRDTHVIIHSFFSIVPTGVSLFHILRLDAHVGTICRVLWNFSLS